MSFYLIQSCPFTYPELSNTRCAKTVFGNTNSDSGVIIGNECMSCCGYFSVYPTISGNSNKCIDHFGFKFDMVVLKKNAYMILKHEYLQLKDFATSVCVPSQGLDF